MRCPHCSEFIKPRQHTYTYPKAKAVAHLACVSQPSAAATDDLIVALRRSNTKLVYSTLRYAPGVRA